MSAVTADNELFSKKEHQVLHVALKAGAAIPITVTIAYRLPPPRALCDREFNEQRGFDALEQSEWRRRPMGRRRR
jgi:hypothetical protein